MVASISFGGKIPETCPKPKNNVASGINAIVNNIVGSDILLAGVDVSLRLILEYKKY